MTSPTSRAPAWRRGAGIVTCLGLLVVATTGLAARQDWRATALTTFDQVWQTIEDTYYDRSFGGVDWAAARTEFRPRAERASSANELRDVIRELLSRLGQSHFVLMTSAPDAATLPGDAVVPVEIRAIPAGIVVTRTDPEILQRPGSPKPGDLLVAIDGRNVIAASTPNDSAAARRARLEAWQRAFRALHGQPGSPARLTLRDVDGRERVADVPRAAKAGEVVVLGHLPPLHVTTGAREVRSPQGRRVGVIAFNAWMSAAAEPFARAVDAYRQSDGIVIDLRGNPGGLADMLRGVAGHFLATPELLGRMHMRDAVLEFRANPRRSTSDGRSVEPFAGPVAILVDELSASASECFAGAMQSLGRARIFGQQTMGQALPASTRALANGDVLMYAVGGFVTSTGQRLEGTGVIPDELISLSPRALAAGQDQALDAAVRWVDAQS